MKRIPLLALVVIMPLATPKLAAGISLLPTGPVNFKLTALAQLEDSVTFKTNKTTTSTNITTTTKSTVETKVLLNKGILRLLTNSLTSLPITTVTNGQLKTDGEGDFFVVTPTSTNNVTSVLSIHFGRAVFAGSETIVTKTPPGTVTSERETLTSTQVATLTYDDSAMTTGNGRHTTFTFSGLLVTKYGDSAPKFTTVFKLTGQSAGVIQDNDVIITGTVSSAITGTVDLDDLR